MRFDWVTFLRRHNIQYVTGSKSSRGHVNVQCPFCGSADHGHHMGVALNGSGWSCWRSSSHRGKSRAKLIQALLRCSWEEALRLSGDEADVDLPEGDVASLVRGKLLGEQRAASKRLELPSAFKPLNRGSALARPFVVYMESRGYRGPLLEQVADLYDLHYCTRDRWRYRVVIPVRDRRGRLLNWTARSILADEELRYDTVATDDAVCSVKDTLLGLEMLWSAPKPRALFVTEGPFDAMWITTFGRMLGVYGTPLFGLNISDAQAVLLTELRGRFDYVGLLLDSAASFQSFKLANSGLGLDVERLPRHVKDPALLSPTEVVDLCLSVT